MIDVLPAIVKGAIAMMDICVTVDAMEKAQEGQPDLIKTASLVNKMTMLGFTAVEIGGLLAGAKSSFLSNLKSIELLPRLAQLPLALTQEAQNLAENPNAKNGIRLVERGIIAPIGDLVRVAAEGSLYYEKHFIEMSPEDLANAKRPIIEQVGEDIRIVGYRPVDLEECKRNAEMSQKVATGAAIVRIGAELGLAEKGYTLGQNVYEGIARFFHHHARRIPAILRRINAVAAAGGNPNAPVVQQVFSLRALGFIPSPLHGDAVFSRFLCPITQMPIRHPVCDPNGQTLYERSAICAWLAQRPVSPVTRAPMAVVDLLERPAVQALIDQRLVHHEQNLWDYLEHNPAVANELVAPPPQNLEDAANEEIQ